jgi:hypothetical protein
MLLVSIVQIDITIAKIVYAEIAVMIVIRNILNGKIFVKDQPQQAIVEEIVIDSST